MPGPPPLPPLALASGESVVQPLDERVGSADALSECEAVEDAVSDIAAVAVSGALPVAAVHNEGEAEAEEQALSVPKPPSPAALLEALTLAQGETRLLREGEGVELPMPPAPPPLLALGEALPPPPPEPVGATDGVTDTVEVAVVQVEGVGDAEAAAEGVLCEEALG